MLRVYEFELFEDDGLIMAFPFDFDGGTQGENVAEASEMAADWLKTEVECRLMDGEEMPEATLGHEPERGGRILLVAVDAGLETIDAVPAHEAADMLGVSRARVSQASQVGHAVGLSQGPRHVRDGGERERKAFGIAEAGPPQGFARHRVRQR